MKSFIIIIFIGLLLCVVRGDCDNNENGNESSEIGVTEANVVSSNEEQQQPQGEDQQQSQDQQQSEEFEVVNGVEINDNIEMERMLFIAPITCVDGVFDRRTGRCRKRA